MKRISSTQTKLLIILVPPALLIIAVSVALFWTRAMGDATLELAENRRLLMDINAAALAAPLQAGSADTVQRIVDNVARHPDVAGAELTVRGSSGEDNRVSAGQVTGQSSGQSINRTITRSGLGDGSEEETLGLFIVHFMTPDLTAIARDKVLQDIYPVALILFVVVLGGLIASRIIFINPISRLLTSVVLAEQERSRDPIAVDGDDEISRLIVAYNRLLDRLKTEEEESERSTRLFRILADHSTDSVNLRNAEGKHIYFSPSHEHLLGYTVEEMLMLNDIVDLVHPDDRPKLKALRQNYDSGSAQSSKPVIVRVYRKDGKMLWIRIATSLVPDLDSPEASNVLASAHDMTDIMSKQQQLETLTNELEHARRDAESNLEVVTRDIGIAKTLQEAILPHDFPFHPVYEIDAYMNAARSVGGDFYEFFVLDDFRLGVAIADVSGKGVPAAFFMSMSRTILETAARGGRPPGDVLTEVNRRLCDHNPVDLFVTMFYGVLDIRSGRLTYSNGGHNNPYIARNSGEVDMLDPTKNIALGAIDDATYSQKVAILAPGDTLFLYTDGFTEAFNEQEEMFEDRRLVESLQAGHDHGTVKALMDSVLSDVQEFTQGCEQSDDLTCLVIRLKSKTSVEERMRNFRYHAQAIEPEASIHVEISNDPHRVPVLQEKMERFCARWAVPDRLIQKLNLCLDEYVTNLISYGYKDSERHIIHINATRTANSMFIEVLDDGEPFNPMTVETPDMDADVSKRSEGGLGVHLIRSFMDEMTYESSDQVNRFSLVKYLDE